jgi:hypothetical protein
MVDRLTNLNHQNRSGLTFGEPPDENATPSAKMAIANDQYTSGILRVFCFLFAVRKAEIDT